MEQFLHVLVVVLLFPFALFAWVIIMVATTPWTYIALAWAAIDGLLTWRRRRRARRQAQAAAAQVPLFWAESL